MVDSPSPSIARIRLHHQSRILHRLHPSPSTFLSMYPIATSNEVTFFVIPDLISKMHDYLSLATCSKNRVNSTFNSQQLSTASLIASFIFNWRANPSGGVEQENMANGNNW
eukprot:scaffold87_cov303-Chaetoceros_neogracile.AAC.4